MGIRRYSVKGSTGSRKVSAQTATDWGFAVMLTLFVLVIVGALVAGGFMVGLRHSRAVAAGAEGDAALYAAEAGLNGAFALLDSAVLDSIQPGGRVPLAEGSLVSGDGYTVQLSRWDAGHDSGAMYYLLESTGIAGGARGGRRRVAAVIRQLPRRDFCCAGALDARGPVKLDSGAVASGRDAKPVAWSLVPGLCRDAVPGDRPGLIVEALDLLQAGGAVVDGSPPVSTNSGEGEYGEVGRGIAELAWRADLRYPAGSVLTGLGPTTWANGECGVSSLANWGAPSIPAHPCFDYFPVIHALGDLVIDGGRGQGVLLVEGDLEIGDGFEFYGIVLVGGSIAVSGGGAQVLGGLRVRNYRADTVRVSGGGRLQYSGCAVSRATEGAKVQGPHPLAEFGWFEILE